jgi:hypothetical protein
VSRQSKAEGSHGERWIRMRTGRHYGPTAYVQIGEPKDFAIRINNTISLGGGHPRGPYVVLIVTETGFPCIARLPESSRYVHAPDSVQSKISINLEGKR